MFSKNLNDLLEKEHLSQAELSRILSINPANLNKWLRGQRIPRSETLRKIAKFFNVSVDYLLKSDYCGNDEDCDSQTTEMIKLFQRLNQKNKTKVMMFAYELEEKQSD